MNTSTRVLTTLLLCLLAQFAHAGTVTYVYTDPQGTPLAEADAQGNIIARYDYAPYGTSVASLGTPPNGPGYTGHVNDPDTGLVYMQARYYDPAVGRFLSTDPVGSSPGNLFNFNRYDYANNNPIKNVDPNGKQEEPVEPESPEDGVDPLGRPLEGPNMGTASPFIRMQGESSSDFGSRQQYSFQRMDSTPEKNATDDAKADLAAKGINPESPKERADTIAGTMNEYTQTKVTISVIETEEGPRVVSSSEGALRPRGRMALGPGEVHGKGSKGTHAEINGINAARAMGLTPTGAAASHRICPSCAQSMGQQGIQPLSPLKQ